MKSPLFALLSSLILSSCGSMEEIDTSTVAGQYKLAEQFEDNERYQEAIIRFTEIKNKYPYSRFATMAELKVADIQFKRESYAESKLAYQIFRDYHPSYQKMDYIVYQIAESSFLQLPESIDRDLSESQDALNYYRSVIRQYPKSEFAAKARIRISETLKKLAEKEMYIANFYFKMKNYKSALKRYENVMTKFPKLGLTAEALKGASLSAFESELAGLGKKYLNELYKAYPNSGEAADLKSRVGKYGIN